MNFSRCLVQYLTIVALSCLVTVAGSAQAATNNTAKKTTKTTTAAKKKAAKPSSKTSSSQAKPKDQTPPPIPTNVTEADLAGVVGRILQENKNNGVFGVDIRRLETGKILAQNNPDMGFIPASVRKVFTTCLALELLGPTFQYHSYLMKTGTVDANGTLSGDLVILPQGDPTFSSVVTPGVAPDWVYRDWVNKVQQQGIKNVAGSIRIDCSAWVMNDLKPDWPTRMLNDTYANFPGPLTVRENLIELVLTPGATGQPATVKFRPDADGYPIINNTVSNSGAKPFKINRTANNMIELSGSINSVKAMTLPADNPTLYASAVFRSLLQKAGINVSGKVVIERSPIIMPTRENIVALYASPELKEIVTVMNKKSENHLAEQLFVSISAIKSGKGGYSGSQAIERDFLAKAGVDLRGFKGVDGCGLSESTRISPQQLSKLLSYMATRPSFPVLFDTLPVSGVDGTLRSRMTGSAQGKVRAKTGTINGVVTLAGYVTTAPGQTYVFTIFVNRAGKSSARAAEDKICNVLANMVP